MYKLLVLLALISCLACTNGRNQQGDKASPAFVENETPEQFNERMAWWREATFGLFVHWGPYAVPAGVYKGKPISQDAAEWIMKYESIPIQEYEQFARAFQPTDFSANQLVSLAKQAGAKYIVITAKHHDGFCMWNSSLTDYNIVDFNKFGRDVIKELADVCKQQGIKLGLYYSIIDWHHPKAQADTYMGKQDTTKANRLAFGDYYENYLKPQVKELVENYDPAILWFDGEWTNEYTHEQGKELYGFVRNLKPDMIINNRVDKGRKGMQGMNKEDADYKGDFGTPEKEILKHRSTFDWETCMTMNNSWGYHQRDTSWKSSQMLIHQLIDASAKGGNYLLNVGPTARGTIPKASRQRLEEIGSWLQNNGKAIYGTNPLPSDNQHDKTKRFAKKGDTVYAFILNPPQKEILLKHIKPNKNTSIRLLGVDEALSWHASEEGIRIPIPDNLQRPTAVNPYAWTLQLIGAETDSQQVD